MRELSVGEMSHIEGGGWLICIGVLVAAGAAIGAAGPMAPGLLTLAAATGLGIAVVCGCDDEIDAIIGGNFYKNSCS